MAIITNSREIYLQSSVRTVPFTVNLSNIVSGYGITINAINISTTLASSYTFKVGNEWADAVLLGTTGNSSFSWTAQSAGIYTVWCVATDAKGNSSAPVSTTVVIAIPGTSSIAYTIKNADIVLYWNFSISTFAIESYEIRYGNSWEDPNAVVVASTSANTYTIPAAYQGPRIWWVAAKNIAGAYSTPTGINITINAPSAVVTANGVSTIKADIIDNNALLSWSPCLIGLGQLPINYYEVRKGTTLATSTVVGSNGNSTFSSIFEQIGGTYTYWIIAYDTAGNPGTPLSIITTINQPPDYVLRNNYNSNFSSGTLTNIFLENGALVGPVDLTQTWSSHYTSNAWNTPAAQAAAGYPVYSTPSTTTGNYEEIIDYGTTIPTTTITCTLSSTAIIGSVSITCIISWKLNSVDAWTVMPAGTSALLTSFRYVRISYTFTATAGSNILKITGFNVKLAIKQKSDSGNHTYTTTASDAANTVTFGTSFIYADTPIVQSSESSPLVPVVIWSGTTNPTSFRVVLYNGTTPTSGKYSWTVRGY